MAIDQLSGKTYGATDQIYGETGELPLDPLHCESIAERCALHNWKIEPHRHVELTHFFYFRAGSARVSLDGETRSLKTPCVLAVPARTVHGFVFDRDIDGHAVSLNEPALGEFLATAPTLRQALMQPRILDAGGDDRDIGATFDHLVNEFTGAAPARLMALKAHLAMILVWVARAVDANQRRQPDANTRLARRMAEFHDLIEKHYRESATLDLYASRLGITPTQLNNICRAATGKTAKRVVHDRVFLEARRNLVYTMLTVNEIATLLGFADPAYFARFFARRAGISPTQYRLHALGRGPVSAAHRASADLSSPPPPQGAAGMRH